MFKAPFFKSAGFVIFRQKENEDIATCQFLLLQDAKRSHHWTPPKGKHHICVLELGIYQDLI